MGIKRSTIAAIGLAITAASPHTASAEPSPTPSASPMSDYQIALNQYGTLMSNREQSKKLITQRFLLAISSANSAAQSALRTAKTADAITAVREQLRISIRLASSARDAANTGLGPLPIEPIKPVKLQETAPLKKTKP